MKEKVIQFSGIAVLAIVLLIVSVIIYRLYFMFDSKKLAQYISDCASVSSDQATAKKLISESVDKILMSGDSIAQAKMLAEIDNIEPEKAIALMALENCYSSGLIARPVAAPTE